jgi:hypothetical protein
MKRTIVSLSLDEDDPFVNPSVLPFACGCLEGQWNNPVKHLHAAVLVLVLDLVDDQQAPLKVLSALSNWYKYNSAR